jgi:transposase InsO family protein
VKCLWIKQHQNEFAVQDMCSVLSVSTSRFYEWMAAPIGRRQAYRDQLAQQVQQIYRDSRGVYGSPRIAAVLKARGVAVCRNTVAKVMKQRKIQAKKRRRFVPRTTDSSHDHPIAGNRLQRDFTADHPNTKWVADLTYVPTSEGWLYLAALLDLYSRKIVGWSMAAHLRAELAIDALNMAVAMRRPNAGLIHHSDRGVQYACQDYQSLLIRHGMICSMSGVGNCYDNAAMESFFSTLKTECVYPRKFATQQEARQTIFEYVEVIYNRVRPHSSLGYVSPETFEAARTG